jgi:hypothetical protein
MLGTAVGIALASTFVAGHTIFQELYVDGVSAGHLEGIRVPDYDGVCPIFPSKSSSFVLKRRSYWSV